MSAQPHSPGSIHDHLFFGPMGALTVNDGFRAWTPKGVGVDDPAAYAASFTLAMTAVVALLLTRYLRRRGDVR